MSWKDYSEMVDGSVCRSILVEYWQPGKNSVQDAELVGVSHVDVLDDSLSMMYSFFDPGKPKSSLGTYMILDNIELAKDLGLEYVYLGFWVPGSKKMGYKSNFSALETLESGKWSDIGDRSAYEPRAHRPNDIRKKMIIQELLMLKNGTRSSV